MSPGRVVVLGGLREAAPLFEAPFEWQRFLELPITLFTLVTTFYLKYSCNSFNLWFVFDFNYILLNVDCIALLNVEYINLFYHSINMLPGLAIVFGPVEY